MGRRRRFASQDFPVPAPPKTKIVPKNAQVETNLGMAAPANELSSSRTFSSFRTCCTFPCLNALLTLVSGRPLARFFSLRGFVRTTNCNCRLAFSCFSVKFISFISTIGTIGTLVAMDNEDKTNRERRREVERLSNLGLVLLGTRQARGLQKAKA